MGIVSSLWRRLTLRRAEAAVSDPAVERELAEKGITLGEPQVMSGPEFLEMLARAKPPTTPTITVTVYSSDSPGAARDSYEDSLSSALEESGLGEWVGGGEGNIGGESFFDISYSVSDIAAATALLKQQLEALGAGPKTTVRASGGTQ